MSSLPPRASSVTPSASSAHAPEKKTDADREEKQKTTSLEMQPDDIAASVYNAIMPWRGWEIHGPQLEGPYLVTGVEIRSLLWPLVTGKAFTGKPDCGASKETLALFTPPPFSSHYSLLYGEGQKNVDELRYAQTKKFVRGWLGITGKQLDGALSGEIPVVVTQNMPLALKSLLRAHRAAHLQRLAPGATEDVYDAFDASMPPFPPDEIAAELLYPEPYRDPALAAAEKQLKARASASYAEAHKKVEAGKPYFMTGDVLRAIDERFRHMYEDSLESSFGVRAKEATFGTNHAKIKGLLKGERRFAITFPNECGIDHIEYMDSFLRLPRFWDGSKTLTDDTATDIGPSTGIKLFRDFRGITENDLRFDPRTKNSRSPVAIDGLTFKAINEVLKYCNLPWRKPEQVFTAQQLLAIDKGGNAEVQLLEKEWALFNAFEEPRPWLLPKEIDSRYEELINALKPRFGFAHIRTSPAEFIDKKVQEVQQFQLERDREQSRALTAPSREETGVRNVLQGDEEQKLRPSASSTAATIQSHALSSLSSAAATSGKMPVPPTSPTPDTRRAR